jgi:hypothetical protein
MAFEISCGECSELLLVEAGGVIVECPHCGAHLSIPDLTTHPEDVPDAQTTPVVATDSHAAASAEPTATGPGTLPFTTITASGELDPLGIAKLKESVSAPPPVTVNPEVQRLSEEPTAVLSGRAAAKLQLPEAPALSVPVITPPKPSPTTGNAKSTKESSPPAATPAVVESQVEMVPKTWLLIATSYASLVTLILIYLLFLRGGAHYLESLPDLVPDIRKDGEVGMKPVLPQMNLAPGHELQLGQSTRFGNVLVTPVKVTRGPLTFEHIYGQRNVQREPSPPVLKLWLRFEHVGDGAPFPPLDQTLVYRKILNKETLKEFSLNFLCPTDQRTLVEGERFLVYDLPEFSEFRLIDQRLNQWLEPGETYETFIPAQEGIAEVDGAWVWRVLFRKGLNPDSGRGVTTLIDVHFDADDVIDG